MGKRARPGVTRTSIRDTGRNPATRGVVRTSDPRRPRRLASKVMTRVTLPRMAADIVPIELSLTAGDLVTLWAPRWREEGEEWEAFLGNDENLFAFTDVAALVGFVRTTDDHD